MRVSATVSLAAVLLAVGTAGAGGWSIAASYPAPAANARGIAIFAPYGVSVLCDGSPPRIYNLYKPTDYISLRVPSGAWGLAEWYFDFFVSNYNNGYIYKVNSTGSVISSFRCPKSHPAGLSGSGQYVAIPDENLALEITKTGSILSSFPGIGSRLTAVEALDPGRGILGDPATHRLYFIGFGTFPLTAPVGVCAAFKTGEPPYDDVYVVDAATNYIYLLSWSGSEAVNPASLGRVKGLFK